MSSQLHDYDVRDGGWQQEPNGFEANAKHVLTHLAKDLIIKDFRDKATVTTAIAPDFLQYAVRLMRWSSQSAVDLVRIRSAGLAVNAHLGGCVKRYPGISTGNAALIGAAGIMAKNLHDHDHASTRDEAIEDQPRMARIAGVLLLAGAEAMAEEFSFDPEDVFTASVESLRERFGVVPLA